jgi:hypothetical protein
MCVSAFVCVEVFYLARWASRTPESSTLLEALAFILSIVIIAVLWSR